MGSRFGIRAPWRRGTGESGAPGDRSWEARPGAARAIRTLVVLGPISVGCAGAIIANDWIPMPSTTFVAVLRSLLIVAISTVVVWSVDKFARKLLPLAALMQLSLVFPDQAPSRFRSALKSGSSRRLERTLQQTRTRGLARDPGEAARQVVQLIGAIGDHDRRTRGHSERVRLYADLLGQELKLSKEERQKLQWGALLHDLGKLMVPGEILNKPGKPDAVEWKILQGHPAEGMRLIEPLRPFLGEWVHAIGGHHEKWDGSGYPQGLNGSQIPRAAAIVAVADSFEVMTAVRSYKKSMSLAEARAELTRCAGQHFSPEVVRAFLQISLGHLRIVSGPLAALAHLPFLGQLTQLPGAAASILPTAASAAMPAAALVTAAALTVGSPAPAQAIEVNGSDQPSTEATASSGGSEASASSKGSPGQSQSAAPESAGSAGSVGSAGSAGPTAAHGATTSTTAAGSTSSTTGVPGTTTPASTPATSPGTTPATSPPTTARTTTTRVTPTTAATPPSTTPATTPTTAKPATTTTAPGQSFTIQVSTSTFRLPTQNLNGASFPRGTKLYIYAPLSNVNKVKWTYPDGNYQADSYPYDMRGGSLVANSWTAPSTPGTYTITANPEGGSGKYNSTTATFTIT